MKITTPDAIFYISDDSPLAQQIKDGAEPLVEDGKLKAGPKKGIKDEISKAKTIDDIKQILHKLT